METGDVPPEDLHRLLRAATVAGQLQPTFAGSALDYMGVQPVLDAVVGYLPSPLDRPPVEGENPNPKKKGRERRKPDASEPLCALVFKIQADQHGDLCFVRVYSGVLKNRSRVLNARTGNKEQINQIWHIQADSREKIEADEAHAGDIVGVIGPKEAATGDTLCQTQHPVALENIAFPETVISMAVEPDTSAERKKLDQALERMARQDPTFKARVSDETGQTIISGMGELHLEVLRNRIEREFNLKVRVHKPRVSYRETIRSPVEIEGTCDRQTAAGPLFARVKLRVEPFEGEQSILVENKMKPGVLPPDLVKVLEEAVLAESQGGGVVGYPLMKMKFTLLDAAFREGETTDIAVQTAANDAVRRALTVENILLLEPIMKLEVVTPDEFLGNIQADLSARHAVIVGSERRGDLSVLGSQAALSQMFGYSTQVRSLSTGRASFTMEPLKYDEAPRSVLDDMLA